MVLGFPRPERIAAMVKRDPALASIRLPGSRLTIFEAAARRGYLKTARSIFQAAPQVCLSESVPMHWLAFPGNLAGLKLFAELGFSLTSKAPAASSSIDFALPIEAAAYNDQLNVVSFLLDRSELSPKELEKLVDLSKNKLVRKQLASLVSDRKRTERVCKKCNRTKSVEDLPVGELLCTACVAQSAPIEHVKAPFKKDALAQKQHDCNMLFGAPFQLLQQGSFSLSRRSRCGKLVQAKRGHGRDHVYDSPFQWKGNGFPFSFHFQCCC